MARSITGFGVVVERICAANNLTQRQIADEIGVTAETVTRWKAEFNPPTADLFRTLSALQKYEPDLAAEVLVGRASTDAA